MSGTCGPRHRSMNGPSVYVGDHLVGPEVLDPLELERIVGEPPARFVAIDLLANERKLLGDDLPHLGLERLEIFRSERLIDLEIVVEAVLDGRAEADLRVRTEPAHRRGQDVRARMTQHASDSRVPLGEYAKRSTAAKRRAEIEHFAIDADRDRRLQQSLADGRDDITGQRPRWHFAGGAVRQGEDDGSRQGRAHGSRSAVRQDEAGW